MGLKHKRLPEKFKKLNSIQHESTPRVQTKSQEFNRVLGGGLLVVL